MELVAVALWTISKTYRSAPGFRRQEFNQEIRYIGVSLIAFFILNWLVPPAVPLAARFGVPLSLTSGTKFVTVMISIPEESLFDGWAAPWFARRLGLLGGALFKALFGTAYHLFVYGDSVASLIIVFGAFFVTGVAVLKTRRLSTVMAAHFGNNVWSVGLR